MAIFRNIQMSFWTDSKIIDDFTPEDRYFYLYLLTNPHTNLSGCYEVSIKQMSDETGYTRETVEKLLNRLEAVHGVVIFSRETKEVLLVNWNKYNWTSSEKFKRPLLKEIQEIKNSSFKKYLSEISSGKDTVSIPYRYRMDTVSDAEGYRIDTTVTDAVTDTDTVSVPVTDTEEEPEPEHFQAICSAIGGFYNERCLTMDRVRNITEKRYALLREGLKTYTLDDYKEVFEKASRSKFLRGEVTSFKADFGWLIEPENMVKVLEGKYDDREEAQQKSKGAEELDEYYKMLENWAHKAEAERLKNEKGETGES